MKYNIFFPIILIIMIIIVVIGYNFYQQYNTTKLSIEDIGITHSINNNKNTNKIENNNKNIYKTDMVDDDIFNILNQIERYSSTYPYNFEDFNNFCNDTKVIDLIGRLKKIDSIDIIENCKDKEGAYVFSLKSKKAGYCVSATLNSTRLSLISDQDLNNYTCDDGW